MVTMALSAEHIEQRLAARSAPKTSLFFERDAAVALVLRFKREAPDVLLMRRIERSDDPWSGQVSLPGGSAKKLDADLVATAVRETHEEVGLDLGAGARLVGALDPIHPVPRGPSLPLHITPFVFFQTRAEKPSAGDEAQRVFWLPLDQAADGVLDSSFAFKIAFTSRDFPCWRYDGEVVWGLTYQLLRGFLKLLREA
jgi:8-oxo-dGTP pyrophosphatase MutT (NUDIX family)